jgi:hypothetical protein
MLHSNRSKRSPFCQLITDYHSAGQRRLASLDWLGVTASALMLGLMLKIARLLLAQ